MYLFKNYYYIRISEVSFLRELSHWNAAMLSRNDTLQILQITSSKKNVLPIAASFDSDNDCRCLTETESEKLSPLPITTSASVGTASLVRECPQFLPPRLEYKLPIATSSTQRQTLSWFLDTFEHISSLFTFFYPEY